MKNSIIITLLSVLVFAGSCNKELGNYTYLNLDSLFLEDIPSQIEIKLGEELEINPTLSSKNGEIDLENLQYTWYLYDNYTANSKNSENIVGHEKDLKVVPSFLVGQYPGYLKVKDNSNGRSWTYPFTLKVSGAFGRIGWFILSEKNNQGHLDYFQDDHLAWNSNNIVYRDFNKFLMDASTGKALEIQGKPLNMTIFSNRDQISPQLGKTYLYLNTENQTYKVNITDGFIYNNLKYNFRNETAASIPASAEKIFSSISYKAMAWSKNNLYTYDFMKNKYYNVPANNMNGVIYKTSPHIAIPMGSYDIHALFYDMDNKRFMRINTNSAQGILVDQKIDDFNTADCKMDLVWLSHSSANNGVAVAIMKNDADQRFLVRFNFNMEGVLVLHSIKEVSSSLDHIANASHFALDNRYGYLFYTANDKLYQYDMNEDLVKVARELNGRKVSMLKSEFLAFLFAGHGYSVAFPERMDPVLYSIMLGTYEEDSPNDSGKIEFLHVQGLMAPLKQTINPMSGFGIVKDIQYTDVIYP